jgi:YVTN family beta-propeller protein
MKRWSLMVAGVGLLTALCVVVFRQVPLSAQAATRFVGPTSSQPLALSANGDFLVVANPDNNSVSFFDLRADKNRRVAVVPVQLEPNGVVFSPTGRKAYVANTVSGTVSVINANIANGLISPPSKHIVVGTEPYSLVLTPNGTRLYVANARSNTVTVIDTATDAVAATIISPEILQPRGLAITNDGDADDTDEKLYVTSFVSVLAPGKVDGSDDAKRGKVTVVSTGTNAVLGTVFIEPLADTGFTATGDALLRIPPLTGTFTTGAYPNQLNNVAIHESFAYLPNTGASPNGPVLFDVNTQSLLSVINTSSDTDAGKTINMHLAVKAQTNPVRLFITQPWAMAFKHAGDEGFLVSAASNIVVKILVDASGAPQVLSDPLDPTRVLQIPVGRNPRGIVVNASDTRAYVMNQVSRNVSVLDLTGTKETVMATLPSASLPTAGTPAFKIHVGRELYNTSVGVFDPPVAGGQPIKGRMSKNGWGACSACHPFGLGDQVVWIFPAGPRRTILQHADFDPSEPDPVTKKMRVLNWSANRDEQEDFENNIRGVSGGAGLIVQADGVTPVANAEVNDFLPLKNGGRKQLKVRGVNAWDALKAFVQFGIRAPISPVSKTDPDVIAGRALFASANCQQCHGGPQWTQSLVRFTPPPDPSLIVAGQVIGELRQVGTFDPNVFNEVRQNAAPPLGPAGFASSSLLSVFASEDTLLHNGAAVSFDAVLNNVTHRSAGTAGVDTLTNAADRAKVAKFLRSIDAATTVFP